MRGRGRPGAIVGIAIALALAGAAGGAPPASGEPSEAFRFAGRRAPLSSATVATRAPKSVRLPVETLLPPPRQEPPAVPANEAQYVAEPPPYDELHLPPPVLKPGDPTWVATRLQVPALGIDVPVFLAQNAAQEDFPPYDGAYILRASSQPGRGTNSYIFAHAMPNLFKPLWGATTGLQVVVTMSDGQRLGYVITGVHPNIPCPDPSAPMPAGLPPELAYATECDTSWLLPTPTERLTMQTSQGFNRNWGELMIVAQPAW